MKPTISPEVIYAAVKALDKGQIIKFLVTHFVPDSCS